MARSLQSRVASHVPRFLRPPLRAAYTRVVAGVSRGDNVACPCCERSFRRFMSYRGRVEGCPGCGSLMRHRLMFLYLRDELRIFDDTLRVLHFAPEASLRGRFQGRPNLDYVSMDLHGRGAMVRGDITDIDAPDASFDFILCSHVLEHVPDDRKAMREMVRVMRDDARAVIVVPVKRDETFEDPSITDPHERDRVFGRDHVRICGRDYRDRLAEEGFAVQEIDYAERLPPEVVARYGLRTGEPFYLCVKAHDRASGERPTPAVTSS